jgi:hypothetical protein
MEALISKISNIQRFGFCLKKNASKDSKTIARMAVKAISRDIGNLPSPTLAGRNSGFPEHFIFNGFEIPYTLSRHPFIGVTKARYDAIFMLQFRYKDLQAHRRRHTKPEEKELGKQLKNSIWYQATNAHASTNYPPYPQTSLKPAPMSPTL